MGTEPKTETQLSRDFSGEQGKSALERTHRRTVSWRWISELGEETTEFHRVHGPRLRDLRTTGWISMGLVILSWVIEGWLARTL